MADAAKKQEGVLVPNRMQAAEHGRNIWLATAESAEHPEDFLRPTFWAHVAKNLQPFDHIELRTDDGTYWAEFLVTSCEKTWAKVQLLREAKISVSVEAPIDPEYKAEWKGPHRKWCVLRIKDGSLVHEGLADRGAANQWLESYVRTVGKKAA